MKTKINNNGFPQQLSYQIANQMPKTPYDYFFRGYKSKISFYQNELHGNFIEGFLSANTPFFSRQDIHSIHDLYMVCQQLTFFFFDNRENPKYQRHKVRNSVYDVFYSLPLKYQIFVYDRIQPHDVRLLHSCHQTKALGATECQLIRTLASSIRKYLPSPRSKENKEKTSTPVTFFSQLPF